MSAEDHFGPAIAAEYDALHGRTDPAAIATTVDVLETLAGSGAALEMAIGTGRIALPLADRGVEVHGIELSEAMVAEMRGKPGGAAIPVTLGDMATTRVPGSFSLVFLIFNTFSNLTTQDAQIDCFRNAADHLLPGGYFVIENAVPPIQRLPFGETLLAFDRQAGHFGTDEIDVVTQNATSHHVWMDGAGARTFSLPFRYVWPSELDLMGKLAGLELAERWADWSKAPFTRLSRSHVSVWQKR